MKIDIENLKTDGLEIWCYLIGIIGSFLLAVKFSVNPCQCVGTPTKMYLM